MREARTWPLVIAALALTHCSDADAPKIAEPQASSSDAGGSASAPSTSTAPAPAGSDAGDPGPKPTPDPASGCANPVGAKGSVDVSVDWAKQRRTARVHVPTSLDASKPAMLVLNFHGLGSDALQEELLTGMTGASDARKFIVAYPQGIGQSWNVGNCCGTAMGQKVDDVGFVRALITKLESEYCVDRKRIFATGLSNGGHMSYRLACEMSDVLGAAASVAGVMLYPACAPTRPIPIQHFHGTSDGVVAYAGNGPNAGFPGAKQSLAPFETKAGCLGSPTTEVLKKGDTTCARTTGCSADLELCTIDGGGHQWPGGFAIPLLGKTSTDVNATNMILDFFEKHPLP